jgi:hypothetical protein
MTAGKDNPAATIAWITLDTAILRGGNKDSPVNSFLKEMDATATH